MNAERGFTLIEVMIALVIFGLTAATIALANVQALTAARQIEEQTQARWVNQNELTRLRLEDALPNPGETTREVMFNNREWEVDVIVRAVEMEVIGGFLRQIELHARPDGEEQPADVLRAVIGEAPR